MTIITVEQTATYSLPVQAVEDIIDGAGMYIGYWAVSGRMDSAKQTYTVVDGDDGNRTYVLTYRDIVEACAKIASSKVLVRSDIMSIITQALISYEDADMDAEVYDVIIQVACFGELVYG